MSDVVDKRLEIVQNRINQYGMRFPVANIAGRIKFDRGYISAVLNGKKPMSDNFWSKFDEAFPDKSGKELTQSIQQNGNAYLPGSVTLQDYIDTLKKQAARAEDDKDKLFVNNETLARALEKLSGVYEKLALNSNDILRAIENLLIVDRSDHRTTLRSLDRLEHQPEGSNQKESDNAQLATTRRAQKKDKSHQRDGDK